MFNRIFWTAVLTTGVCVVGCNRQPQIDKQNRRLLESLKTAVMAKNGDWLERNEKIVEARHDEGKLSDDEYDALESVIREAKTGDWSNAADELQALAKGQVWSK